MNCSICFHWFVGKRGSVKAKNFLFKLRSLFILLEVYAFMVFAGYVMVKE